MNRANWDEVRGQLGWLSAEESRERYEAAIKKCKLEIREYSDGNRHVIRILSNGGSERIGIITNHGSFKVYEFVTLTLKDLTIISEFLHHQ